MVVAERKILSIVADRPYFIKDNFVLYHGDSINILNQLAENSIDMIFADPPYNLSNGGFSVHAGRMVSVNKGYWDVSRGFQDDYAFHYRWLEACKRVLKPHGTLWVSGTYHSIYQCGHALQSLGYHILNDISWFKPNASPNLSCRFFTASHETIIWARKDKKAKHIFNYNLMKDGNWPEDKLKKPNLQMRSVWSLGTPKPEEKKYGKHPTQKPLDLLNRIVLASTNKGDVILDPFAGSSTTGIAAAINDRKIVGIVLERLAGLKANVSKAPNGLTYELKSVSFHYKKDKLVPKETMAITMINPKELKESEFFDSHCWAKLKAIVFCVVAWHGKNAEKAELLEVISLDFSKTDDLIMEIKTDYDFIRNKLITQGFDSLTGKDGKWIQARTKGSKNSETRTFYARPKLVAKIFEMAR